MPIQQFTDDKQFPYGINMDKVHAEFLSCVENRDSPKEGAKWK